MPLHKPDLEEKLFFLISGMLLSVPFTLFIDRFAYSLLNALPTFYATLVSIVVFAPFIEEFAKVYPLFYRHGETQRSFFTLSFLVGLGFGIFEFLTYVALGVPILARLPGIFFHPMNTSITGYGIATKHTVQFYLLAVALHFSFNLSAAFYPLWPNLGIMAVLLLAFFLSWRFYHKTSEKSVG